MSELDQGVAVSIFCVRISGHAVINIIVRSGEETKRFKDTFPDALAHDMVWLAKDPIAEVMRQRELVRPHSDTSSRHGG